MRSNRITSRLAAAILAGLLSLLVAAVACTDVLAPSGITAESSDSTLTTDLDVALSPSTESSPITAPSAASATSTDKSTKLAAISPDRAPATNVIRAEATVTKVVDGDTIEVSIAGVNYTVNYIGVDAPVMGYETRAAEPYWKEAVEKNRQLVEGKIVTLVSDVSQADYYGRLPRYVYLGETFVNAQLLYFGLARYTTNHRDKRHADFFQALEEDAQANRRGLWGLPPATD